MPEIKPAQIGKVALWLYKQYPLPDVERESSNVSETFAFFRPSWAISED
jgi:hypothetical protein